MNFQEELSRTIPDAMHDVVDYKALQDAIRIYGIQNKGELLQHIEDKSAEINRWLLKNNSTGISAIQEVSQKILKLEQLKSWKKMCDEFL